MDEVLEFLKAVPFLGDLTLITIAFILVMTGKLVPGTHVDRLMANKDQQIADWRAAAQNQDARSDLLVQQNTKLLEQGKTTVQLLKAIVEDKQEEGAT